MCSTQRWSTSNRKIEKAFLGRSEGSESCVTSNRKKRKQIKPFQPSRIFPLKLLLSKLLFRILTLWHLSKAWRVSCSRLTTSSGDRKVSPCVSMIGPRGRLVRCLIRSFSSWILQKDTDVGYFVTPLQLILVWNIHTINPNCPVVEKKVRKC